MPQDFERLEEQRMELIDQLARLGDFRAGSITSFTRRCGKPGCHCARQRDPGHGPSVRLTYKLGGKTVTESLPDKMAVARAKTEIAEFRKFQDLSRKLVAVNSEICRLRHTTIQEVGSASKKNERRPSNRRSSRK
jgi:hypothetical protein